MDLEGEDREVVIEILSFLENSAGHIIGNTKNLQLECHKLLDGKKSLADASAAFKKILPRAQEYHEEMQTKHLNAARDRTNKANLHEAGKEKLNKFVKRHFRA